VKASGIGNPKNILIRGVNWVGDAVISIPAMREIRRIFPDSHIALLVRPWVADIYSAVEFIDEIIEYDKNGIHRGWAGFRKLIQSLRSRRFDLAVLLQNAFEAAWIAGCARIPIRAGYARDGRSLLLTHACKIDPSVLQVHQAHYYLGLLAGLGLLPNRPWEEKEYPLTIGIGVRDPDRNAAREMLRSGGLREGQVLVGINPGAFYGEAKRWFPDRYAGVADALVERFDAKIVLFGSSTDLPVVEAVASNMKHASLILAGKSTLGQLMGLIKECNLLITNDSGPMHLAAALDVPQIALFGSTSEIATGPLSRNAVVIKHPVECNPCFLRKCPTDFRCMKGILRQQVIEAAQKKLEASIRGRGE
jgi:heptosyltransferase II